MVATPADPTDEDLAEAVARRDRDSAAMASARRAFGLLYDRHARLVLGFLSSRCRRNDLDDLHQDVWRRAWEHLPGQFHGGLFRAWLFQIARNALYDLSRRRRPSALGEAPTVDPSQTLPEDRLVEFEQMAALAGCLGRLDEASAGLVRARLSGEDYAEIGLKMGLTPARAHKLFHRAKKALQDCVGRALG